MDGSYMPAYEIPGSGPNHMDKKTSSTLLSDAYILRYAMREVVSTSPAPFLRTVADVDAESKQYWANEIRRRSGRWRSTAETLSALRRVSSLILRWTVKTWPPPRTSRSGSLTACTDGSANADRVPADRRIPRRLLHQGVLALVVRVRPSAGNERTLGPGSRSVSP
jgi:hypothetical protein